MYFLLAKNSKTNKAKNNSNDKFHKTRFVINIQLKRIEFTIRTESQILWN